MRASLLLTLALSLAACVPESLNDIEDLACAGDSSCPAGRYCTTAGRCIAFGSSVDPETLRCATDGSGFGGDRGCPQGLLCRNETCHRKCATTDAGSVCAAGETCKDGACFKGKELFADCETNADCTGLHPLAFCDTYHGRKVCLQTCDLASCDYGMTCVQPESTLACDGAACKGKPTCLPDCGSCPAGWDCAVSAQGTKVCVPGKGIGERCDTNADCASNLCYGPPGAGVCSADCSATGSCRSGICTQLRDGKFCMSGCTAGKCASGAYCWVEVCVPGKPTGSACTSDAECANGPCRKPADGFRDGMCTAFCNQYRCNASEECRVVCRDASCVGQDFFCWPKCGGDGDCRPGYGCVSYFGAKVCRPKGAAAEGGACVNDADCANGSCVLALGKKTCRTRCAADSSCGPGLQCSVSTYRSYFDLCGAPCSAGCGAGETCGCYADNTGGGAKQGCIPKCTTDADCLPGSVCDTATGACGRKSCQNAAQCPAGSFCAYYPPHDASCGVATAQVAACRFDNAGVGKVGERCGQLTCDDAMCGGAYFKGGGNGYCTPACPDGTGCPSGTSCKSVRRPLFGDGSGTVSTVKFCVRAPASNTAGPCGQDADCPTGGHCTATGYCTGPGALGAPCANHNFQAECDWEKTGWCIWNGYGTTCSKTCAADADCTGDGFPGGCCRFVSGVGKACLTAAMCK